MYKVVLECDGVSANEGDEAAKDIAKEFAEHRKHHAKVTCSFTNGALTLISENDFDKDGLATLDEFGDCVVAYIHGFPSGITIMSVEVI